jgi:hypothetical protein
MQICNTTMGATRPTGDALAIDRANPIATAVIAKAARDRLNSVVMKAALQHKTRHEIDNN